MIAERALHLLRPHLLAAGADHVLQPAVDPQRSVLLERAHVARAEPAVEGERRRRGAGIAPVALHDRGSAQLDPVIGHRDPHARIREAPAVVHHAAAGLREAVRRDDAGAQVARLLRQRVIERVAAHEQGAEPREIHGRVDETAEHGGHHRHERALGRRRQPLRIEALVHLDRRAQDDAAQQHEHAAHVRGREAGDPGVRRRRPEHLRRRVQRRGERVAAQLDELRHPGRPGGRHDQADLLVHGFAHEHRDVVVLHRRPPRGGRGRAPRVSPPWRGGGRAAGWPPPIPTAPTPGRATADRVEGRWPPARAGLPRCPADAPSRPRPVG